MKRLIFLLVCCLSIAIFSCSSNTAKNSSITNTKSSNTVTKIEPKAHSKFDSCKTIEDTTFRYNGKPIWPPALWTFYTTDTEMFFSDTGAFATVVDLDTCSPKENELCLTDTFCNKNKLTFTYGCSIGIGSIDYKVIYKNNMDIYCIYSKYYISYGPRSSIYSAKIFFIAIQGNKLLRLSGFSIKPNLKYKIVGGELIYGYKHYKVPKNI